MRVAAALFGGGALINQGLALALAYETYACATGKVPTISAITAEAARGKPKLSIGLLTASAVFAGALAAHFFDWRP